MEKVITLDFFLALFLYLDPCGNASVVCPRSALKSILVLGFLFSLGISVLLNTKTYKSRHSIYQQGKLKRT